MINSAWRYGSVVECMLGMHETLGSNPSTPIFTCWASLVAQMVKNMPTMLETWVWSLDWEDPLEKEMTTHSSILAWRIPWAEEPGRLLSMGLQAVGHDWATKHKYSHLNLTTGKTIVLPAKVFIVKVMSLIFNMLSRFVIAFLPRSKHLVISCVESLSTVILEPKKIKSVSSSTFSPSFAMKWWDQMSWC